VIDCKTAERDLKDEAVRQAVLKSIEEKSIDFTKYGWVSKIAKLSCVDHVSLRLRRIMPDFYQSVCYKRGEHPKKNRYSDGKCKICGLHFDPRQLGGHIRTHRSFESLNGDRSRRNRLIKENSACSICGLREWMGKTIPIELDHIDGNPDNNVRENLRLLCLNCHGQTDTYRNKNRGRATYAKRHLKRRIASIKNAVRQMTTSDMIEIISQET
jgi:5-methylcytosine-specific restriction endonuclease McrA